MEDAGAIEQPHHDRLAVHGGNGRDADVHAPALQRDADAPVLRQAPLGDVHLRHDLDARRDGRLQPARGRLLIEEHAVDAVPDAQRVLERLDVDVGGARADRVLDEQVDEAHDGRLEGHVAQVVHVLVAVGAAVVLHAFDDALDLRRRALVGALERVRDRLERTHHDADRKPRGLAQIVADDRVQRIGGRDGQDAAVHAERADAVLPQVLE